MVLVMNLVISFFQGVLPLKEAGNAKITLASEDSPNMNSYDLDTYTLPYWKGNTVYHESVMVRKEQDGSIPAISLLYPATEILSVRSSDLQIVYEKGIDWNIQNGKLVILDGSKVPFMAYDEYYPSTASSNTFDTVNGGKIYFSEGSVLHKKQLAVTYKHSASWEGSIPKNKGNLMPKTIAKLKNNEKLKILFYGDSITTGANSSGAVGAAPYAVTWMEMFVESLKKTYDYNNITPVYKAVGGKTSDWGVQNAQERVAAHNPDLLVVGFGMNDGRLSPSQHKDNINTIIRVAKAANPNVEVLIVSTMLPNPEVQMTVGNQALYESELLTLETEGIVVAPVTSMHKYLMEHKRYSDMTGNNVNHPNDFVARLYAQTLIETMVTGTPSTGTGTPSTGIGAPGTENSTPSTGTGTSSTGTGSLSIGTSIPSIGTSIPSTGTSTPSTGTSTPSTGTSTPSAETDTPSTETNDSGKDKAEMKKMEKEVINKNAKSEGLIIVLLVVFAVVVLACGCVVVLLNKKKSSKCENRK